MKLQIDNRNKHNRGQSIMEFALAIPFILILLIGVIEAAWMMFFFSTVSIASRESARYGAAVGLASDNTTLHYNDCVGIRAQARRVGAFVGLTDDDQIRVYFDNGPADPSPVRVCNPNNQISNVSQGQRIKVEVIGHYQPLVNIINIPTIAFTSQSSYTIMTDIQISK